MWGERLASPAVSRPVRHRRRAWTDFRLGKHFSAFTATDEVPRTPRTSSFVWCCELQTHCNLLRSCLSTQPLNPVRGSRSCPCLRRHFATTSAVSTPRRCRRRLLLAAPLPLHPRSLWSPPPRLVSVLPLLPLLPLPPLLPPCDSYIFAPCRGSTPISLFPPDGIVPSQRLSLFSTDGTGFLTL